MNLNISSSLQFDVRIQILFPIAGAVTGFLLFFINMIHRRMMASRIGLAFAFEFAVLIGVSFLIRDDTLVMGVLLTGYLALVVTVLSGLDRLAKRPSRQESITAGTSSSRSGERIRELEPEFRFISSCTLFWTLFVE